jgi:transposase-like protein
MAATKDRLKVKFRMLCPDCNRKDTIGFLGGSASKRFFCKECCLEFVVKCHVIKFIIVDTNGVIIKEPD